MKNLNPTLWRTCRMLAGETRIRLLRRLHDQPGLSVSQLAAETGIGRSDASQELRRIQSRGLLKPRREGLQILYRIEADPQVTSAAPLIKALKTALASLPPERDGEICRVAFGLAYPRRIAIARELLAAPRTGLGLARQLQLSGFAVYNHIHILAESGWARRLQQKWHLVPPEHPLAGPLLRLLKTV